MAQPKAFTLRYSGLSDRLLTPCKIGPARDRTKPADFADLVGFDRALWDTGATHCCISKAVVARLGLVPDGVRTIHHAGGASQENTYRISISLPNGVYIPIVAASEATLNGFDMIIGMAVISMGDFSLTHLNGKTTFSFRMPSTHEIDFVKLGAGRDTMSAAVAPPQNRKDPCQCGSGRKYLNCHGVAR